MTVKTLKKLLDNFPEDLEIKVSYFINRGHYNKIDSFLSGDKRKNIDEILIDSNNQILLRTNNFSDYYILPQ